jgi:pimeloyl-ACP methyl ester carboxylesterase
VTLHSEAYGSGPAFVILHGLFGSGRNWHSVATQLANRYQVHALDLRNHGRSAHRPDMSYEAMAADVSAFIDRLGSAPVTLLGHSMGGKIGMLLALTSPALVERLVIVDIAPVKYPDRFEHLLDAMQKLPLDAIRSRADADQWLRLSVPEKTLRLFLLQNLARVDGAFEWRLNLAAIRTALPALMRMPATPAGSRYRGPTAFLRGETSPAILPEHHPIIKDLFPNAEIETIANAAHLPHTQQPEAFMAALLSFLDSAG